MRLELTGINVPTKVLESLLRELPKERQEHYRERLTPIILSAAYARISRSQKDVFELIEEASDDVPQAKKSAQDIAFGMGHHSISDHCAFNFGITNVSRLCIEDIEERRIAGYTEKSQRYVTLDGDFVRPKEFSKEDLEKFESLVALQNDFYFKNNEKLQDSLRKKFPEMPAKDLEGKAKEDARYSLSLATEAQLGCTYYGETLEHTIRKLKNSPLKETRDFAKELSLSVKPYSEVIQLMDEETFAKFNKGAKLKEDFFKYTKTNLEKLAQESSKIPLRGIVKQVSVIGNREVSMLNSSNIDLNIITSLLFANSTNSLKKCLEIAELIITSKNEKGFIKESLKYLSAHDKVPREFETGNLIFVAPISSSCFAQLKRHRMTSLLKQDYNPALGIVVPSSIKEIGATDELKEVCKKSSDLFYEFLPKYGKAAEYCLTNAHMRRVLISMNMRELYHISRTREDSHAQWEIRALVNKMTSLAKEIAPYSTILLGGKHKFDDIRKEVYGE